jgi:hypothetical protein
VVDARQVACADCPEKVARDWIERDDTIWTHTAAARIVAYAEFGTPRNDLLATLRAPQGIAAIRDLFFVRFFDSAYAKSGRVAVVSARPPRRVESHIDIPEIDPLFGRQGTPVAGAWLMLPAPDLRSPAHHVFFTPGDGTTVDDFLAATNTRASAFRQYLHRVGNVRRALGGADVVLLPVFSPVNLVRGNGSAPRILLLKYDQRADGVHVNVLHAAPATLAEVATLNAEFANEHSNAASEVTVTTANGMIDVRIPAVVRAIDVDPALETRRIENAVTKLLTRDAELVRRLIDLPRRGRAFGSVQDETRATVGTIRRALTTRGFTLIFGKDDRDRINVLAWLYTAKI